jgi:DNA-binding response OmpR family regulator
MIEQKNYEIAIIDLMMPRLSGYELVQKIGALNPRPAILVATAMASSDVASLDDSLVRRVIRKPFDIDAVAKALMETAKHIAEQREQKSQEIPVAPPEAATLPVVVNVAPEEEPAPVEEKPSETEKPAIQDPPKNAT